MQSVHRDTGAGLYRLRDRATTGRMGEGGLIGLLCLRNARSRTPLVGRAQCETDSGHPPGGDTRKLGRSICMCGIHAFDSVVGRTHLHLEKRAKLVDRHKAQRAFLGFAAV